MIALTYSLFFLLPLQTSFPSQFFFFSVAPFLFILEDLFVPDKSSLFLFQSLCPIFFPHASLALDPGASFSRLPSYFGPLCLFPLQLIACSLGSKRRHFFSHFMSSLRSLFDPPVRFPSPFIFLTFLQCQSAPSVGPFWTSFFLSLHSHLLLFSLLFCYIPGFSIQMSSFLPPSVSLPLPTPSGFLWSSVARQVLYCVAEPVLDDDAVHRGLGHPQLLPDGPL